MSVETLKSIKRAVYRTHYLRFTKPGSDDRSTGVTGVSGGSVGRT